MNISEEGLKLIESFEGFRSTQYNDGTGVMTIGFGTTSADISPLPEHVTMKQAEDLLRHEMAVKYEPAINDLRIGFNQNEFDALCSLAYNCGPGIVSESYQIGRDLRDRNFQAAAGDFMHYVYAGGQVLQGLVTRRRAEQTLFLKPWVDPDPHHYRWFDMANRDLGDGHHGSERSTVMEYDNKRMHPHLHAERLARLRDNLGILAARLEVVIHDDPEGNTPNRREWRHSGLIGRADGRRYV